MNFLLVLVPVLLVKTTIAQTVPPPPSSFLLPLDRTLFVGKETVGGQWPIQVPDLDRRVFFQGQELQLVHEDRVHVSDAAWLRLHFDRDRTTLLTAFKLRMTSLEDGYHQWLDQDALEQWSYSSAYFNGDTVTFELFAASEMLDTPLMPAIHVRHTETGRFLSKSDRLTTKSLCHRLDQRKLAYTRKSARMMPVGCTAWMINDRRRCFLSAGHCTATSTTVLQFQVPLSHSDGTVRHPHPDDQYVVDMASAQTPGMDDGNDWLYIGAFPNSNTKLPAFKVQNEWYTLHPNVTASPQGMDLLITGYGAVYAQSDLFRNQVQQSHRGPVVGVEMRDSGAKWTLRYQVDTMGGNSGSALEDERSGYAVGIHTNAGCRVNGGRLEGSNHGTFLGNSNLQKALQNPRGVCR